jgi:cytochrome c556
MEACCESLCQPHHSGWHQHGLRDNLTTPITIRVGKMFNTSKLKFIVVTLSVLISTSAFAVDMDSLVKARQGIMRLYGVNMDLLGDMIRKKIPYNQKQAQQAADNLVALSKMNHSGFWPLGSSLADQGMKGKTSAKPEIWIHKQEVTEHNRELTDALAALAGNAGWTLRSLKENMPDVNAACRGCHKKFRAKN